MEIRICKNPAQLGASAAKHVAQVIRDCIAKKGCARIALSTGASQFDTIRELVKQDVDWSKVEMFHLDEYVDLPETHGASFRKYLKERFVDLVENLGAAHFVDGTAEGIAKSILAGKVVKDGVEREVVIDEFIFLVELDDLKGAEILGKIAPVKSIVHLQGL